MVEVPVKLDPAPQMLFLGSPIAIIPDKNASKSSVKLMLVAKSEASEPCASENRSVTLSPGNTESSRKVFVSWGAETMTSSSLAADPVIVAPSIVAVIGLVVVVTRPLPAVGLTSKTT